MLEIQFEGDPTLSVDEVGELKRSSHLIVPIVEGYPSFISTEINGLESIIIQNKAAYAFSACSIKANRPYPF